MAPSEFLLLGVHARVCSPPTVDRNVLCNQQEIADGMQHGFQNSLMKQIIASISFSSIKSFRGK